MNNKFSFTRIRKNTKKNGNFYKLEAINIYVASID